MYIYYDMIYIYVDTNEMELENEHENAMLEDEEEEDEDDDDDDDEVNPLRLHNDDYEDIDTEYEPICFDRASDDFILNNRLKPRHKEKSLSLQDLSISKKNAHLRYNKKRHGLNAFRYNYLRMQQNPILYPATQKRQMIPSKYQHVESKVKQYIKNVKEQNRRSMEKRMKEQEFTINKNYEENESKKYFSQIITLLFYTWKICLLFYLLLSIIVKRDIIL